MSETLSDELGRDFDGLVGRLVDWLGTDHRSTRTAAPNPERVRLLRYTLVSVRRRAPAILERGELMVVNDRSAERISEPLIERYLAKEAGAGYLPRHLRVHFREAGDWSRRQPPETPTLPEPAPKPKSKPKTKTMPKARPKAKATARPKSTATKKRPTTKVSTKPKAKPKQAPKAPTADGPTDLETALSTLEDGATLAQLVRKTGASRAELRTALARLIEDGTVERAGEGLKTLYRRRDPS